MNDKPKTKEVKGTIKSIGLQGLGPNSGELTLVIDEPSLDGPNYYAAIIDEKNSPEAVVHGVFAGFVSIATLAYASKATVQCTYKMIDKPRITQLVIVRG